VDKHGDIAVCANIYSYDVSQYTFRVTSFFKLVVEFSKVLT